MELEKETPTKRGYDWYMGNFKRDHFSSEEVVKYYNEDLDDLEKEKVLIKLSDLLKQSSEKIKRKNELITEFQNERIYPNMILQQWKKYYGYNQKLEKLQSKIDQLRKEKKQLNEIIHNKEVGQKSLLDYMNELRSKHDHELLVNNLLKKQIKELKNEIQIYNNIGQRTNVPSLSEVGYQ